MSRPVPQAGYAPDGSPVELYARLAVGDEPRIVHAALPPGAALLELGCGAGRVTHPLVELGHPVTAVDNSAEMLEHVRGAEKVLADIRALDLRPRVFDGVVLASHLVNYADADARAQMLACCRRHVAPGGAVILQRLAPGRMMTIEEGSWTATRPNAARQHLTSLVRRGRIFAASVLYELEDKRWTVSFEMEVLSDDEFDAALARAGLARVGFLDDHGSWVKAAIA